MTFDIQRAASELAATRADVARLQAELQTIQDRNGDQLTEGDARRWDDTCTAQDKAKGRLLELQNEYDGAVAARMARIDDMNARASAGPASA